MNLDWTFRLQEYNQAEQLVVTEVAWIPLNQIQPFWNVPTCVHNFSLDPLGVLPLSGNLSWQTVYLTAH